jgi:hypothetical protein
VLAITGKTVSLLVQDAAAAIGLDPREYGAQSLRRGGATDQVMKGRSVQSIAHSFGLATIGTNVGTELPVA